MKWREFCIGDDQSNVFYHVHKYFIHKTLWKIFIPLDQGTGGIIKVLRVSVYLGNDWELSHFNTLMFVAICECSVHSTRDDDSQVASQLVRLFVLVENYFYILMSHTPVSSDKLV